MLAFIFYQILIFGVLLGTILIQSYFVYPIESSLLQDSATEIVSLLYLPHGIRVIFALLIGSVAAIPMFAANFIGTSLLGFPMIDGLIDSLISTACVFIPIYFFNYLRGNSIFSSPFAALDDSVNLFRSVMVLAFLAALINAVLSTSWFSDDQFDVLAFRFLIGDMVGTFVVLVLLLVLKKTFVIVRKVYKK